MTARVVSLLLPLLLAGAPALAQATAAGARRHVDEAARILDHHLFAGSDPWQELEVKRSLQAARGVLSGLPADQERDDLSRQVNLLALRLVLVPGQRAPLTRSELQALVDPGVIPEGSRATLIEGVKEVYEGTWGEPRDPARVDRAASSLTRDPATQSYGGLVAGTRMLASVGIARTALAGAFKSVFGAFGGAPAQTPSMGAVLQQGQ